jgi:hypothetical protein
VAQRGVRAAVDAADPTTLLSDGVHARGLHDRADPLRRQVAGVIEAVLADIGERDLPIHPNPVPDPDAQVPGKYLDPAAPQDLPPLVPQVLDPHVRPVPIAALHRRRRDPAYDYHLARLQTGEFGQGIRRPRVRGSYPGPARREERREHRHQPPPFRHQPPPHKRPGGNQRTGDQDRRHQGRRDRADADAERKGDRPQVQANGRAQV